MLTAYLTNKNGLSVKRQRKAIPSDVPILLRCSDRIWRAAPGELTVTVLENIFREQRRWSSTAAHRESADSQTRQLTKKHASMMLQKLLIGENPFVFDAIMEMRRTGDEAILGRCHVFFPFQERWWRASASYSDGI